MKQRPPAHVRRARFARTAQLLLAFASVAFVLYRLAALFTGRGR